MSSWIPSLFSIRRLFSGASSPSRITTMDASKDEIIKYIKDPRGVTMFSKSFCPYCKDAKKRINGFLGQYDPKKPDKERPYKVIEIDLEADGQDMQNLLNTAKFVEELKKEFGTQPDPCPDQPDRERPRAQWTVPNIWIGGKQIGGCSDLEDLSDKEVRAKLEAAGAKLL